MLSSLLGPLKFEDEDKEAEAGDDEVMESGEKDGEKKEGQEGEEPSSEKKDGAENQEKTSEEGNPENKEENKKPSESVSDEGPKAEKYVLYR